MSEAYKRKLSVVLHNIKISDTNYDVRYPLVFKAMYLASLLGYQTGQKQEDNEWYILYILNYQMVKFPGTCPRTILNGMDMILKKNIKEQIQ